MKNTAGKFEKEIPAFQMIKKRGLAIKKATENNLKHFYNISQIFFAL